MGIAPTTLAGLALEWTGRHHSETGDFQDLSTHTICYESENTCYALAGGKVVGEAKYTYQRLDDQVAIVIYHPDVWQGRNDVELSAIFDFSEMTDRAVITSGGQPFAVALGNIKLVPMPPRG